MKEKTPESPSICGIVAVLVIVTLCMMLWKKNHRQVPHRQKAEVGQVIHAHT